MKRVLTYGTYDLITPGHIQHLKESKEMGDYLIVGLSTDEFNAIKHKQSYLSYEERKIVMEAIKYVDEVIPEKDWDQKPEDIKKYNIDILTMGSDWEGNPKFEYLKEYCLVDYIECEYNVSGIDYKTNSIFGVPHGRFKIGEEIRIFYEHDDNEKFFCDINKKYSNLDTIDF